MKNKPKEDYNSLHLSGQNDQHSSKDEGLNYELNEAIKKGDSELVKELLKNVVDINRTTSVYWGFTPLGLACYFKHLEVAEVLIEAGADVNKKIENNNTALRISCDAYEQPPIDNLVKLLLEKGANPNAYKKGFDGPIHYAAMFNQFGAVKLLIKYEANVNSKGNYKRTPLIYAASSAGNPEMVKYLIDAGAEVNAKNGAGENALFELITCEKSNKEIAKILLDKGISILRKSTYNDNALHWAAFCGKTEIVELLIDYGVDIEQEDHYGDTAIIRAMSQNKMETVKLIFEKGANPESKSKQGFSLLEYVAKQGDIEFLKAIIQQNKKKNKNSLGALSEAAKRGDLNMVKLLIDAGIEVDERSTWGSETALMKASYYGKLDVVEYLLKRCANIKACDSRGNTPLLHAAWSGQLNTIKCLLEHGADINEKNALNWNALMQACVEGHFDTAKFLLEKGSPLDEIDLEKGATALTLAKYSKSAKLVELLKSYGAQERPVKMRKNNQPYFSIFDCGICQFLPNKKDLGSTEKMEQFNGLELFHSHSAHVDRYCDHTDYILKCVNCGTYYHQFHSIDTEDAFVGGPSITQNFLRYNLIKLKETLKTIGKNEEFKELELRYNAIIEEFNLYLKEKYESINKNFLTYVIESLTDYYIIEKDWFSLKENLLNHSDKGIALETAHNLIIMSGENFRNGIYPFFTSYKSISHEFQQIFKPFFIENVKDFQYYLQNFDTGDIPEVINKYKSVLDSAKYYKIL